MQLNSQLILEVFSRHHQQNLLRYALVSKRWRRFTLIALRQSNVVYLDMFKPNVEEISDCISMFPKCEIIYLAYQAPQFTLENFSEACSQISQSVKTMILPQGIPPRWLLCDANINFFCQLHYILTERDRNITFNVSDLEDTNFEGKKLCLRELRIHGTNAFIWTFSAFQGGHLRCLSVLEIDEMNPDLVNWRLFESHTKSLKLVRLQRQSSAVPEFSKILVDFGLGSIPNEPHAAHRPLPRTNCSFSSNVLSNAIKTADTSEILASKPCFLRLSGNPTPTKNIPRHPSLKYVKAIHVSMYRFRLPTEMLLTPSFSSLGAYLAQTKLQTLEVYTPRFKSSLLKLVPSLPKTLKELLFNLPDDVSRSSLKELAKNSTQLRHLTLIGGKSFYFKKLIPALNDHWFNLHSLIVRGGVFGMKERYIQPRPALRSLTLFSESSHYASSNIASTMSLLKSCPNLTELGLCLQAFHHAPGSATQTIGRLNPNLTTLRISGISFTAFDPDEVKEQFPMLTLFEQPPVQSTAAQVRAGDVFGLDFGVAMLLLGLLVLI
ncbi:hypothetical protein P9112_003280 [Eukaryota sp. TZLM1-RC]